ELAALDDIGQLYVFEDSIIDGFVSADAEVCVAANKKKLTVGGCEMRFRIGDLCRRVDDGEFAEDERHERALPEASDDLARRVGKHRHVMPLGLDDGNAEVPGRVDGVGVDKEQPLARRGLGAGPD